MLTLCKKRDVFATQEQRLLKLVFGSLDPSSLSPTEEQGPCSWRKNVVTISRSKTVTQGHALSLVLPHAHKDVNRLSWGPGFPNNIKNAVPAFFTPRPYMKQNLSHFWVALTL